MAVSQTIFYFVRETDPEIKLMLIVGEAQKGATVVRLGETVLVESSDDVVDVVLGSGADVKGKKCLCTTVVTDINPVTNRTSVTWGCSGGAENFEKTCTETLDHDGDSILYAATIYLL